jgi:hypothetical protein
MGSLVPVVEGFSEVEAMPVLLRRFLEEAAVWDLQVAKPFRVKRQLVVRDGELERAVALAVSDRPEPEAVVIVLDADDDCPATLGPALLVRARSATALPVILVLANREYEGWLLGAKQSLRGTRGIRDDANAPDDPEAIRDAKGRLSANMTEGERYVEVEDQAALTQAMSLHEAAGRCPSFEKLRRDLTSLLDEIRPGRTD